MALFSRRHDVPRRDPSTDRKTDRLGMVWPCFHAGTTSPAGTLRLKRKSPVPTGSAAREPSLAGDARFSSLVAAPGHGGLISNHALTAMPPCVFAGGARP